MKSVASLFQDDHSVTIDVKNVTAIELDPPMEIDEGQWACSLIIRAGSGFIAIQMVAASPESFTLMGSDPFAG
ncbi:MAG: Uncharacterized protein FD149_258 [Rhodospirillaceae bacterium]|nr:MAG: Uncharacterized protein FD149_258 [Rhodospirillaceae bacterium]